MENMTSERMFTDEAWAAGWDKAQSLGLAECWAPAMRPATRRDVEEIVSAVANHGFEEIYADQMLPDDAINGMRGGGAMERLREHMRKTLAIEALEQGCVMITLPREVARHPEPGLTAIRLIVPVRRLVPAGEPVIA
jgi:hypothetical protein